ncbi:gamma-butyrobetaine dioxygenase-like isoform X2 [Ornithodoros turicata]|uniref:gamma-butyrobetaine dioxygenase-like isoform X2 n=1 Tax=Ornithodoros turicata TaxID=34597 RepID=UPI003139A625
MLARLGPALARRLVQRRLISSTVALHSRQEELHSLGVATTVPLGSESVKVIFNDDNACDLNYIWLRDNCPCPKCVHPDSKQKLVDTAALDFNVRPQQMAVTPDGSLDIIWNEGQHESVYDPIWLYKNARSYMLDSFHKAASSSKPPPLELWDRVSIWKNMPELSYKEFMTTEEGLFRWLDLVYRYGVVILRDVPQKKNQILEVVNRVAYVKSTIWGDTFDVVCQPVQNDPKHLAYTGMYLEHHTDMNYREKSPGLQMLHCLESSKDPGDHGGKSFLVDGFMVANWLRQNNPAAFHILSSTPVQFSISSHNMRYSQTTPIICVGKDGNTEEIHYNNRTMAPLQAPPQLVKPFYHALKEFVQKLRDPASELSFHMVPGDLVAFNNRRVLHGRTSFDPTKVSRHLQGCYAELDEVFTRYFAMRNGKK